ncbi:hypothetical protein BS78_01G275500 [Paspalum vaginatum]|nr:hypothetical protein BS78_01G275500 [Paspalum vaginatum]
MRERFHGLHHRRGEDGPVASGGVRVLCYHWAERIGRRELAVDPSRSAELLQLVRCVGREQRDVGRHEVRVQRRGWRRRHQLRVRVGRRPRGVGVGAALGRGGRRLVRLLHGAVVGVRRRRRVVRATGGAAAARAVEAGELLHDGHEVARVGADHLGRVRVDDHRFVLLRPRRRRRLLPRRRRRGRRVAGAADGGVGRRGHGRRVGGGRGGRRGGGGGLVYAVRVPVNLERRGPRPAAGLPRRCGAHGQLVSGWLAMDVWSGDGDRGDRERV